MNQILIAIMFSYYVFIVILLLYMFLARRKSILNNEVRLSHFKSYTGSSTEKLVVLQNHFNNQFQIPVIFLIACTLAISQNSVNVYVIIFSILFVISRIVHSIIHLGTNNVLHRASSYFVGIVCVFIIWFQIL